jgi:Streptomyces extracellular neutral proteinase (M7) family
VHKLDPPANQHIRRRDRVNAPHGPGGVVPYYNAAPDQAWAVAQAVRAWNQSGAHIRFVAVGRASAKMVIEEQSDKVYCSEAHATVGFGSDARMVIFPAHGITHDCNRYWAARVVAHELGHVLGLLHEDGGCATMNSLGSIRGGAACEPKLVWD